MFQQLGNIASLMRQAQQMSGRMQELHNQLRDQRVEGIAGGGLVKIEANGHGEVLRVAIDPALFQRGDREMIEDLLQAAFNAARDHSRQAHAEAMRSMTSGMNLPGLDEAIAQVMGKGNGA